MKPEERAQIQKFRDIKIDALNIITNENLRRYDLVSKASWKWTIDANTCGLSKEVLVMLLTLSFSFSEKGEWALIFERLLV